MRRSAHAFTLLELVAVLMILGLISGVAVPVYMNMSTRANQAAEAGAVGAVRSAITQARLNMAASGTPGNPANLDVLAAGSFASSGAPFFSLVLAEPVTSGWSKGSDAFTYISPAGNTFIYDPTTGLFDSASAIAAASAALAASGSGSGGSTDAGTGGTGSGATGAPGSSPSAPTYTNSLTWTAGVAQMGNNFVGAGYALNGSELMMTDSYNSFVEASRRVALAGGQAIQAGTYSLALDTELTDYSTQLNYWMVIGVKNGTTLNLSGDTLRWGSTYSGVKTLYRDYAPPQKSDGTWYTYNSTFTVSAADAAAYDQIVVVMAGSRFPNQSLGWRTVSLVKQP